MADISKCPGKVGNKVCKKRNKCYRYTAPSGMRQSVFVVSAEFIDNCDMFWDNTEHKTQKRKRKNEN